MTDAPTMDFFDRLEDELRQAASRPPRRRPSPPPAAALVVAALAIGALALIPIVLLGGNEHPAPSTADPGLSPIGTILPKGSGRPRRTDPSMVVAHGETKLTGLWQLEVSKYPAAVPGSKEPAMQAGNCLILYKPLDPRHGGPTHGGYCGPHQISSPKTPGFTRQQELFPRRWLILGRAPRRASKVVVTVPGEPRREVEPIPAPRGFKRWAGFDASFYVVVVSKRDIDRGARVNWLDASGRPGGRGLSLATFEPG
jgi:hypothetical protein